MNNIRIFLLFLFIACLSNISNSQSINELESKKKHYEQLQNYHLQLSKSYLDSIEIIDKQIRIAESQIDQSEKLQINQEFELGKYAVVRREPLVESERVKDPLNKTVLITRLINENYSEIVYKGTTYYATNASLTINKKTMAALKYYKEQQALKEQQEKERIERIKRAKADSIKQAIEEQIRLNKLELQAERERVNEAVDDANRKADARKKSQLAERRKSLIEKYGNDNGLKIHQGKIWIGMSAQMLSDSWGEPNDKNITISTYSKREQWVYGMGKYVYLKDGIVTSIQY